MAPSHSIREDGPPEWRESHSMCSVVWTVRLTPGNPATGAAKTQMLVSFVGLRFLYQTPRQAALKIPANLCNVRILKTRNHIVQVLLHA